MLLSSSSGRLESDGSLSGDIETAGACVPIRRSNSASVILGLVRAVRLSGPGIPPRRIALLIDYPPARFLREIVLAGTYRIHFVLDARSGSLWFLCSNSPCLTNSPSEILRGFQKLIIFTDGWIGVGG